MGDVYRLFSCFLLIKKAANKLSSLLITLVLMAHRVLNTVCRWRDVSRNLK